MKLKKISISNFRSIDKLDFDNFYQNLTNKNKRAFNLLIGLNESGKSSILQAIKNVYSSKLMYEKIVHKPNIANSANNTINVKIYFDIDSTTNTALKERSKIFSKQENLTLPEFDDIQYVIYNFELSEKATTNNRYYINSEWYTKNKISDAIKEKHDNFLWSNVIKPKQPKIIYWTYKEEFLLPPSIDLNSIIDGTLSNTPIENIFKLAQINIEKLGDLTNPSRRKTIARQLQTAINKHFKTVWKSFEANVQITIEIEQSGICTCLIEDKDNQDYLYETSDRSDGFRQFISFILSISCEETTKNLENSIILLDEPDVHLHPSGITFLRDRLISISKNNVVVCATHSPFMIDKTTPESHILVSKKRGKTNIERINKDSILLSDEVMRIGFGLNYWKELLPQHILLVEGNSDKVILNKIFEKMGIRDIFVQSCNGSEMPKMYRYATIDKLNLAVLHDNDASGETIKKQIEKIAKDMNYKSNNVFSIKHILKELPEKCEFEDILEEKDITPYIKNYEPTKNFRENTKGLSKDDIEQLKIEISNNYTYKEQNKMKKFINNLIELIKNEER